jgi:hypothetical protein
VATRNASGGGLYSAVQEGEGPVIKSSIFADNRADARFDDLDGKVRSQDYNLIEHPSPYHYDLTGPSDHNIIGQDPLLGLLGDNGGGTQTHALQPGSPAIDSGSCTDIAGDLITSDQRGIARPQGIRCDIGAYEFSMERVYLPLLTRAFP